VKEDVGSSYHGRAWKLMAKANEEQSMRLLGMNVDLNRLTSWGTDGGTDGGSTHDLEVYGFIDPPVGDAGLKGVVE
jgi:hypothetical protein